MWNTERRAKKQLCGERRNCGMHIPCNLTPSFAGALNRSVQALWAGWHCCALQAGASQPAARAKSQAQMFSLRTWMRNTVQDFQGCTLRHWQPLLSAAELTQRKMKLFNIQDSTYLPGFGIKKWHQNYKIEKSHKNISKQKKKYYLFKRAHWSHWSKRAHTYVHMHIHMINI